MEDKRQCPWTLERPLWVAASSVEVPNSNVTRAGRGLIRGFGHRFGHRLAHGHEFFGRGRVNADGGIEHRLGRAGFQRHGDAL